jgi:hypothetical protein
VNSLHFGGAQVHKGAIHPCGSNCHCDCIGSLKYLCYRTAHLIGNLLSTCDTRTYVAHGLWRLYQNKIQLTLVVDGLERKKNTVQIQTYEHLCHEIDMSVKGTAE